MKILMLTSNNTLQDGINRHILTIAPAIQALGRDEVAVCITSPYGELNVALETKGIKTFSLSASNGHDLRIWRRFGKVLNTYRPDVIHGHVISLFVGIYLRYRWSHIPIVKTVHGITDVESGIRKKSWRDYVEQRFVSRVCSPKIAHYIYISEGVRRFLKDTKGFVIHNPMSFTPAIEAQKDALRDLLGLSSKTQIIGTACRLSIVKCPELLTHVMCAILKERPSIHAVVCGDSADNGLMSDLRNIVNKAGVASRFHWLGYRKDAPSLIRSYDCFIMTSWTEGMPTALLEAMATKTPIAFMRGLGGLLDLEEWNKKDGPFAVVGNRDQCQAFIHGIIRLLDHPQERILYTERAFAVGKKRLDLTRIVSQLQEIYHLA